MLDIVDIKIDDLRSVGRDADFSKEESEAFSLIASSKYGNDAFLSQMDSDTTIEIVVSKYGGIAMAYFLGYTGIPSGYYLDEIRQNINPILERKKYRCRVLPNGRITA